MMVEDVERIAKALRLTGIEFGTDILEGAILVGPGEFETVSLTPYHTCPTLAAEKLGGVSFKVARFFETILED